MTANQQSTYWVWTERIPATERSPETLKKDVQPTKYGQLCAGRLDPRTQLYNTGNEVTHRLAKEAAQEARNFPEDRMIVSQADIGKPKLHPVVMAAGDHRSWKNLLWTCSASRFQQRIQQPLAPYYSCRQATPAWLNGNQHKLDQTISNQCQCGEVETTAHFLLCTVPVILFDQFYLLLPVEFPIQKWLYFFPILCICSQI